MPIEIKITADTPEELTEMLQVLRPPAKLAWRVVDDRGPVGPVEASGALDAKEADRIVDETLDKMAAGEPTNNAMLDEIAEKAKTRRGRPRNKPEEAPVADPTPVGPQEAETLVHSHVPDEQKAGETFDIEACKAIMRDVTEKVGYDDTRALLAKFQVGRLSLLDPSLYGDFVRAGREMLAQKAA